jgi:hypothetical protein
VKRLEMGKEGIEKWLLRKKELLAQVIVLPVRHVPLKRLSQTKSLCRTRKSRSRGTFIGVCGFCVMDQKLACCFQ